MAGSLLLALWPWTPESGANSTGDVVAPALFMVVGAVFVLVLMLLDRRASEAPLGLGPSLILAAGLHVEDPVASPAHRTASRNGGLRPDRARGRRHFLRHALPARGLPVSSPPDTPRATSQMRRILRDHRRAEGGQVPDRQRRRNRGVSIRRSRGGGLPRRPQPRRRGGLRPPAGGLLCAPGPRADPAPANR